MPRSEAYIVGAVRSPVGKRGGALAEVHPADLGAHALRALMERTGVDPEAVEDVVFGCLDAVGPQAGDIARTAWLAAGLPESVPGVTVDRQCGSSQQAVHFAAQAVMSGTADLVVAGGVQNMSQVPIAYASRQAGDALGLTGGPYHGSAGWRARYGDAPVNQFHGAELIADQWGIDREEMERWALRSHRRALRAIDEGRFEREIAPFGEHAVDEGPRRGTSLEKMAALDPAVEGGRLTAAVSSQISDASSAMLLASEEAVRVHNLTPRARVHHLSVRGEDPIRMLSAPIPATRHALRKAGMTLDDIDLVEINEAFASVVLAWLKDTGCDPEKVNVNGGAIALGHPLGATGTKLMTTLLHELERTGGRYGLQTMCEGGGQANVTVIERL
ncbi:MULTISPECIES: acetyl-CoA C-acetyltransferase [Streptomyces]|uniref:Acetyl-CoA C-acetyltransferase n=1 Tax=Streptomyces albus TaxID=1888 RepID=A0A8H1L3D4_9ACTN|nr:MULTISPECIES: acetyl-CoA C-acetyltransferase [Streptomyces]EPD94305.1 acetyl-CoA C-acetyltransferase [Streptomyces sp. HPH0547]TGG76697.1 acetyl-CoA C-acetyltransferase [Streptomyces albus]UVN54844.1 acetyl-CoA C-acetyltransferase [Streptomyces albus]GHJ18517.1 acetyl-CoA acetyltransferase [Streptomyces albus]